MPADPLPPPRPEPEADPEADPAGDPLAALPALLAEERALILRGAWDGLAPLIPRKARAVAALEARRRRRLPPGLATDLARNQALLLAALAGLKDAAHRRAALASARSGRAAYDAQGARVAPPGAPSRIERRA